MRRFSFARVRTLAAALFGLAAGLVAPAALADDGSEAPGGPYFYKGYDYGSQSLYSPVWVFVNRGFDVLQMHVGQRNIFRLHYGADATNVANNLFVHPFSAVAEEGRAKFFREEIFPVSYTRQTARWIPNYTLHLFGGGMTFTSLREWSEAQGTGKAAGVVIAASTILASAFVNETLENGGMVGRNTDCIADFWFFDIPGMLLFSIDGVNRFFSRTLIVSDWSLQPSFTLPTGELHNQGNYFAAKLPVPYLERLRLFAHGGMGTMFGLSLKVDSQYSISGSFGSKVTRLENSSAASVENTISFAQTGALFFDRNESLLASAQVSNVKDYFVQLNLYPNAFVRTDPGLGLWSVFARDGGYALGVSITRAFGLGVGYAKM